MSKEPNTKDSFLPESQIDLVRKQLQDRQQESFTLEDLDTLDTFDDQELIQRIKSLSQPVINITMRLFVNQLPLLNDFYIQYRSSIYTMDISTTSITDIVNVKVITQARIDIINILREQFKNISFQMAIMFPQVYRDQLLAYFGLLDVKLTFMNYIEINSSYVALLENTKVIYGDFIQDFFQSFQE